MVDPEHACSFDPAFFAKAEQVHLEQQSTLRAEFARKLAEGSVVDGPASPMKGALPAPPGFVGALANFIYQQAPLPIPEVAVVAALGLMAGICGKAWHIPGSGLNLYIVLVARSAIGKEAMHSGISKIVRAAVETYPQFGNFIDFSDYASGPALIKACAQNPCFVNVAGEIGHKFLEMADAKAGSPMRNYRKQLTSLYSKSGPDGISGGISYSSQDNNVATVQAVAFSLIGETTPKTFYESITDAMLADGFMSRFCIIEYTGDRPDMNDEPLQRPNQPLLDAIVAIAQKADSFIGAGHCQEVSFSDAARTQLNLFRLECHNAIITAGDNENERAVWNRAHLNALRVSALLAVGDNYIFPVITDEHAAWAIALMRHGTSALLNRLRSGEVGEGSDGGREQKALGICLEFLTTDKLPNWLKDGEKMQQAGIVPRRYLQQRTQRLAAFEKHYLGHTRSLDDTLKTAVKNSRLMDVKKEALVEQFGFHGQAYRVLDCRPG